MECNLGNRTVFDIRPDPGYFAAASIDLSGEKPAAYSCPNPDACPGGKVGDQYGCKTSRYKGPLCAQCQDGYIKTESFVCRECSSTVGLFFQFFVLPCLMVAGFVLLVRSNVMSAMNDALVHSVVMKVFLAGMQLNSMVGLVDFKFPKAIQDIVAAQAIANLGERAFLNFRCISPGISIYKAAHVVFACLPWAIIAVLSSIHHLLSRCARCKDWFRSEHLFVACCVGVMLSYLSVVVSTVSIFRCREVDGEFLLLGDVSIICGSSEYNWLLGTVSVPSIILNVVGIPAAAFFVIRRNLQKLEQKDESTMIKLAYLTKGELRRARFLFCCTVCSRANATAAAAACCL
jgi:hypothetical protein